MQHCVIPVVEVHLLGILRPGHGRFGRNDTGFNFVRIKTDEKIAVRAEQKPYMSVFFFDGN